jgi:hypothetical protein
MLNVAMLSVVMLNVVAPQKNLDKKKVADIIKSDGKWQN